MALPPSIPTSFVPHPSGGAGQQRFRANTSGIFGLFAYALLGVAVLLALGVFIYGRLLASEQSAKDAALAKAESSIDSATVEGFVRLRDRLDTSQMLLDKHVALSNFFTALSTILPSTVRFKTLHVAIVNSGTATLEGTGVAKSFNALAAVSAAFAADGRIKDAIFSKLSINKDNSVSFDVSATLDPKLIAFSASAPSAPSAPLMPTAVPATTGAAPSASAATSSMP